MAVDEILGRIEAELGMAGLARRLAELPAADLRSLLMAVYAQRAPQRAPAELLREFERNRFVRPSPLRPAEVTAFDERLAGLLPGDYELLELSPLAPLGTCSALATVHQNKVVSATRGEVVADGTNVLALEAARRRRLAGPNHPEPVRLATHQRVTRAQAFDGPDSFAHFRLLSLVRAGRDPGDRRFELDSLCELAGGLARVILDRSSLTPDRLEIAVTSVDDRRFAAAVSEWVERELPARLPRGVRVRAAPEREAGRGYYEGVCFKLLAGFEPGRWIDLGDGGSVDWTRRLLGSRKERLFIAGLGTERLLQRSP